MVQLSVVVVVMVVVIVVCGLRCFDRLYGRLNIFPHWPNVDGF